MKQDNDIKLHCFSLNRDEGEIYQGFHQHIKRSIAKASNNFKFKIGTDEAANKGISYFFSNFIVGRVKKGY